MRSSFTGVTFTPGTGGGFDVWSRGRRLRSQAECGPRHLYESGELFTLCGVGERDMDGAAWWWTPGNSTNTEGVRTVGAAVHVSKARRTDCHECRRVYRARLRDRRDSRTA